MLYYGVKRAYSGFLNDEYVLTGSASGGIAYALALEFLRGGEKSVYSVRYSSDFKSAEYARVDKLIELKQFQGSKYIESKKIYPGFDLYKSIEKDIEGNKKILFIGLPCDAGAIEKRFRTYSENLYIVDLVCHGPTINRVAEEYIEKLEKQHKSKIINFTVRYKKNGQWTPPYLKADFENGDCYLKEFYQTEYGRAFSIMSRPSCYNCFFKGEKHISDITIGDHWGLDESSPEYNKHGVSICFIRTEKGEELLKKISKICTIKETDMYHAMKYNPCLNMQKEKHTQYESFIKNFNDKGLFFAVKKSYTTKEKIKICLKKMLPQKVIVFIKYILNFF